MAYPSVMLGRQARHSHLRQLLDQSPCRSPGPALAFDQRSRRLTRSSLGILDLHEVLIRVNWLRTSTARGM